MALRSVLLGPDPSGDQVSSLISVLPGVYCGIVGPSKGQNPQGEQGPTLNRDPLLTHQAALAPIPPGLRKTGRKQEKGKKEALG